MNFLKIGQSICNILPVYLRQLFTECWNSKYPEKEWQSDDTSGRLLINAMPYWTKYSNSARMHIELVKTGNEKNWDLDVLTFVMLYSGINLLKPCRHINQRSFPLRASEHIERIRTIRDTYIADLSSMRCPSADFKRNMTNLKSIAKGIFPEDALEKLEEIECAQWRRGARARSMLIEGFNDFHGNL